MGKFPGRTEAVPAMKEHEEIRALRNEIELKEQELADQKWIVQQLTSSISWRVTEPLRWAARRYRGLVRAPNRRIFRTSLQPARGASRPDDGRRETPAFK